MVLGGITMATALVSALTGVPTRADVSMTARSRCAARCSRSAAWSRRRSRPAHRDKTIVLPRANEKDLAELPEDLRRPRVRLVDTMEDVLQAALERPLPGARNTSEPTPARPARAASLQPSPTRTDG